MENLNKTPNENEGENEQTEEQKRKQEEQKRHREEKIDSQLEQSFPASDPPSYSQPGNELSDD